MGKMGKGNACGPDELSIEAIQIILEYKPECIVEAFNNILRTNQMPNEWRKGRMVLEWYRVMYWNATTTEVSN